MNALELADELERLYQQDIIDGVADLSMPEAATMLRQQHAEIENLRKIAEEAIKQGFYEDDFRKAQKEIAILKQIIDANNLATKIGKIINPRASNKTDEFSDAFVYTTITGIIDESGGRIETKESE